MENKKNKSIDYASKRYLFLGIGLCASLLLVLSAFQIRAINEPEILEPEDNSLSDFVEIERTAFQEPKPPKPKEIKVITVENEEDIPEIDIPIELEFNESDALNDFEMDDDIPEEETNDGIVIAEVMASYPGGQEAWVKFLRKNLEYPKLAKRGGIEGKVFMNFVVDKNGNVSNIEVVRGIGAGCDDEAIRVLKMSPKWNPGLQRGHPVKSRMSLFIHFVLK